MAPELWAAPALPSEASREARHHQVISLRRNSSRSPSVSRSSPLSVTCPAGSLSSNPARPLSRAASQRQFACSLPGLPPELSRYPARRGRCLSWARAELSTSRRSRSGRAACRGFQVLARERVAAPGIPPCGPTPARTFIQAPQGAEFSAPLTAGGEPCSFLPVRRYSPSWSPAGATCVLSSRRRSAVRQDGADNPARRRIVAAACFFREGSLALEVSGRNCQV